MSNSQEDHPAKSNASRLFGGYLTDVAAHNFRRIVEVVGYNDVAALFLFGLAVVAIIWLQAIEGDRLLGLLVLFAILLFYYRMSGTRVRLAQLKNEAIRLKLEEDRTKQLDLLERPTRRDSEKN